MPDTEKIDDKHWSVLKKNKIDDTENAKTRKWVDTQAAWTIKKIPVGLKQAGFENIIKRKFKTKNFKNKQKQDSKRFYRKKYAVHNLLVYATSLTTSHF